MQAIREVLELLRAANNRLTHAETVENYRDNPSRKINHARNAIYSAELSLLECLRLMELAQS